MAVYLGIDMGTTGLKALLIRPDGSICGSGYREYPISIPQPGFAEQNPEHWWRALRESLAEAMADAHIHVEEISGIGLSGQMHGTVFLGKDMKPLYPAIIWCDQRSAGQAMQIRECLGAETLGKWVQNPVAAGFQVCSLLWMRENIPDLYRNVRHVLLPKDYLRLRLTGMIGTEATDACGTLLFNSALRDWSREMLSTFSIDRTLLPDAQHTPMEIQGTLTECAALELGLRKGIPVCFGGGDQPMQAVGNGILSPGEASITLGTGGQIFVPISAPVYDSRLRVHTFCHAPQNTWYVMGAILNCCLAQNWFFDKVLSTRNFADLHARAAQVAPGSNGLFFLPYLTGERTPHMNPHARGIFFGLTLNHDRASMTRAVLEGIGYALMDAMDCIQEQDPPIDRLILSGGGARSPLWKQIIADMLDRPIYTTAMKEAAGTGAAICAMVGTGAYRSLSEACRAIVHYDADCVLPNPANTAIYKERHRIFRKIYEANCALFAECGA